MSDIMSVLSFALSGLTESQQSTADNLANADTPGYTASEVHFQASLQQALQSQAGGTAMTTQSPDPTPPSTNGNNVNVGSQLVNAEQETMQYQAMVDMFNAQYRLVQGASGGSFQ